MIDPNDPAYFEREQSQVKQYILREYLLPFALIIGTFSDISYVDCCAGPWQSRTEDYGDTSFGNAISALTGAKEVLARGGHSPRISCLFIEKDQTAFDQLTRFCSNVTEIEAEALQGDFTEKISDIKAFLKKQGSPFPFFFIDPTGWMPIRVPSIRPVLQINPGEVLINFMTSHIRRFLSLENLDFDALFGQGHTGEIAGLHGKERDEAAVFAYASEVKKAGGFDYICTTVVPNPLREQAHFHLIYGTRSWKGVEKFKEAEKRALKFAGGVRSRARERERERRTQQPSLQFGSEENVQERYLDSLRARFLDLAGARVDEELDSGRPTTYGSLAALFLRRPLVWESDFRGLMIALRDGGAVEIDEATPQLQGISPNAKVRKRRKT